MLLKPAAQALIHPKIAMTHLSFPFTEEKIRALKVGDEVLISGIVHTGRDAQGLPAPAIDGRFSA